MKRWLFLCSSIFVLWTATAFAELYTWTDRNGDTHYSDRLDAVPPEYRDQVKVSTPVERAPTTWDSHTAAISNKKQNDTGGQAPVTALIEKIGLVKFVIYSIGGFLVFLLVQVFILKKACRLVGENEPWGLGHSGGIAALEWFVGILPNTALMLVLHFGLLTASATQVQMTAYLGASVLSIILQILVLRMLLTKSVMGAVQVWLGQILVTLFLAAIVAGLGYLLSFCSGFLHDASK